jgi:hypothetical protein
MIRTSSPTLFARLAATSRRCAQRWRSSRHSGAAPFADLDTLVADSVAASFHGSGTANAATLERVILQCYYRDDRVLNSPGIEPRPPFQRGHVVEQGDWSLLDAVRNRPQLWRDDRAV